MHLQWILNPLTCYALLALAIIAVSTFFGSLKVENAIAQQESREAQAALSAEIAQLRTALAALESAPAARTATPAGIDLHKRAQALRMHKRGEPVTTIAAALETPRNEIELLLKVAQLHDRKAS